MGESPSIDPLGHGIYTVAEASRYTGVHHTTIWRWLRSCPEHAVFCSDYAGSDFEEALSFLDLIDVLLAGHLRKKGITLKYIRDAYQILKNDLKTKHPFCHKDVLYVSNKQIFVRFDEMFSEAVSKQGFDKTVMSPFLEKLDFSPRTKLANRWKIHSGIVLDPEISFGKPVIESTRLSTSVLAKAYAVNDQKVDFVAEMYEVRPIDVMNAVDFEAGKGFLKEAA